MNSDNVVMWVTRLSFVDWVFVKIKTLLATVRTRNQPQEESYASLEVEHLFPSVECARNKRRYPTVLQNHEIISLDAELRMDGITCS